MKIEKMKERLKDVTDPRRSYGNIRHKLEDIIIIGLCTVICGGEDYADMEEFGKEREDFLRKLLELPSGIPDCDTFRRVFERIIQEELSACLVDWLDAELPERCVIAVDGKTIKGSQNADHKAYHVVSAFVAESQITLGEVTVDEKSNEITAVPELLDLFWLDDTIITADSMSCQKKIVEKIVLENADYVIALKSNQRSLYNFAKQCFSGKLSCYETREHKHGQDEIQTYYLNIGIDKFPQIGQWSGLKAIGKTVTKTVKGGKSKEETRYFISSVTDIKEFSNAVRKHWSIKNQLHWNLDIIFKEDKSRAKKDNSPLNLNVL